MNRCTVPGCEAGLKSLGLCIKHYTRWRNHGDLDHVRQRQPLTDRLLRRLVASSSSWQGTPCLEWQGSRLPKGYGKIGVPGGYGWVLTHRAAYEIANMVSLTPDQVVLHECDNPPCCNPLHLRLGSTAENNADMLAKGRAVVFGKRITT